MTDKETKINTDYLPILYKIDSDKNNILTYDESPKFSQNIDYPKFSFGFHHFIHQSKKNFEDATKEFEDKKKVYYIISKFEIKVDDYELDISTVAKNYFSIGPKPDILSRAFYKLWEIFFMFDVVDLNADNFVSAHLAEGPGSFIQATMFYRDKFSKKSKNDKYYAVTLHAEGIQSHVHALEDKFVQYYSKEKPARLIIHKTYPTNEAKRSKIKDNGDLTDAKTRKLFGGNFDKQGAHLVTADGGFDWKHENLQEQDAFKLILAQVIMALKIQEKGGSFICKVYETFTNTTSKLINILLQFYDETFITKPLISRLSNTEKYIVCLKFKDHKTKDKDISKLESVLDQMNGNKNKNLVDMFPDFNISNEFKTELIKLNVEVENKLFKTINEMIVFIKNKNYRGDEYVDRRKDQISASEYWIDTYFPDAKDYIKSKHNVENIVKGVVDENKSNVESMQKKLDFN